MPDQDAVLAITGGLGDMQAVLTKVWDHLLPGFAPAALTPDCDAQARLSDRLAALRHDPPTGQATSPLAAQVSGREIRLAPNAPGIDALQCTFGDDGITLTFQQGRRRRAVTCGLNAWQTSRIGTPLLPRPAQVAAAGCWTTPDTVQLVLRYYETPFYQTLTLRFTEAGAEVAVATNVSFGSNEALQLVGTFA